MAGGSVDASPAPEALAGPLTVIMTRVSVIQRTTRPVSKHRTFALVIASFLKPPQCFPKGSDLGVPRQLFINMLIFMPNWRTRQDSNLRPLPSEERGDSFPISPHLCSVLDYIIIINDL